MEGGAQGGGTPSRSHAGVIAGAVVGSIAAIAALGAGIFYYRWSRNGSTYGRANGPSDEEDVQKHPVHAPASVSPCPYTDSGDDLSRASEKAVVGNTACSWREQSALPPRAKGKGARPAGTGRYRRAAYAGSSSVRAGPAAAQSISATEVVIGLREEVQELRRAMQQMQAERFEAPPRYE